MWKDKIWEWGKSKPARALGDSVTHYSCHVAQLCDSMWACSVCLCSDAAGREARKLVSDEWYLFYHFFISCTSLSPLLSPSSSWLSLPTHLTSSLSLFSPQTAERSQSWVVFHCPATLFHPWELRITSAASMPLRYASICLHRLYFFIFHMTFPPCNVFDWKPETFRSLWVRKGNSIYKFQIDFIFSKFLFTD